MTENERKALASEVNSTRKEIQRGIRQLEASTRASIQWASDMDKRLQNLGFRLIAAHTPDDTKQENN